jgi:hypothetical protein
MFLLDTNALSELRLPERASGRGAVGGRHSHHRVLRFGDFASGGRARRAQDGGQERGAGESAKAWIDGQILPRFEGRILPVDAAVALRCAPLHVPDPKPERDALIAATTLVHGLTLVTRNVEDFASTGARVLNPCEAID